MTVERIADLLHEAAETHHTVYRITDGTDPDWASWYANWLIKLSELPALLGKRPVPSHLVHALVDLDRTVGAREGWELAYAARLLDWFGSAALSGDQPSAQVARSDEGTITPPPLRSG